MIKFADPTNDVAFKKIFSEDNIDGIKDFVETVISNAKDFPFSTKFKTIEFLNKDHMPGVFQGKKSLCDLKVKDDKGNTYIIEMQKRNEQDYLQRIQYYSAHAITDQLEQGIGHTEINPVITISIMSRKCFDIAVPCISYHPFKETVTNKQFLDSQSHIFIELLKLEKSGLKGSTLEWLQMFKNAPKLEDIPPSLKNTYVEKAYHRLEQHNWTSEEKQAYIDAKIADDMEKSNIRHAINEGISKGKNEKAFEMAKNMRIDKEPIEKIEKYTGLTKEQILAIKI
jgi:predicted transposase/invertase (TIGR01784 family)